ncbi:MAG: Smr/MutS family protein [Proteobacteria bacterium]|nr:Smr/MutS family protein [Pseudomonadota bacterium]
MKDPDRHGEPSDEDAQAFRSAMHGVKPLQSSAAPRPAAPRKRRRRKPDADDPAAAPPPVESEVLPEQQLEFRRPGVQDQLLRKLRRGLIAQQAEADLHGLTLQEAWDHLDEFITAARTGGMRCVRVIHGKGYRSGARGPVLKSAVNAWLRHNHDVIAFVSARTIDGGTGAVYVLLRA